MSYGPFCRLECVRQTSQDAVQQVGSGEIRGHAYPGHSGHRRIRAYPRRLHAGERGITFTTPIAPDAQFSAPHEARWYFPLTPGVTQRTDATGMQVAALVVVVTNLQP